MLRHPFPYLIVVLCLWLQACALPRPFEHSKSLITKNAPTLAANVICIPPLPALPDAIAEQYRTAITDNLLRREHLAASKATCSDNTPTLQVVYFEREANQIVLDWQAHTPGHLPKDYRQVLHLPPSPQDIADHTKSWSTQLADQLGYLPPRHRSVRSLYDGLPEDLRRKYDRNLATSAQDTAPVRLPIHVAAVSGADDQGNTLLRYSMLGYLRRAGYDPKVTSSSPAAPYAVSGQVSLSEAKLIPGKGMVQNLRIVWSIQTSDGQELSSIRLENGLPQGLLPQNWRAVADAVAASSINEIIKILNQAELARTR